MKIFIIGFICCLLQLSGYGQQVLKGKIVSEKDSATVSGALITSGERTTSSDAKGEFSISLGTQNTIRVKAMGYADQQVNVKNVNEQLVIYLREQSQDLQEVIVSTGYQQLPRERATGSFVQVDQQLLNRSVTTKILDRLADVVPGLIFNRNIGTSETRGENGISVRGRNTIFAKSDPLIVLDNFPYEGDLASINPNDIESITVLRDAAAASIWGAKAGNGVIVITSKKGKYNQPLSVNFNAVTTTGQKPDLMLQPRMSSADYIDIERLLFSRGFYTSAERSINKPALSPIVELLIAARDGKLDQDDADAQITALKSDDVRTDLDKYYYQPSFNQQYSLQINGGTPIHRYLLSAGYDKNRNTQVGNGLTRLSLRFNNNVKLIKDVLELSTGVFVADNRNQINRALNDVTTLSYGQLPYTSLADAEGNALELGKLLRPSYLSSVEALGQGLLDWRYKPLDDMGYRGYETSLSDYQLNTGLRARLLDGLNADLLYQYAGQRFDDSELRQEQSYYVRDQINRLTIVNTDGSLNRPIPLGGIRNADLGKMYSHNLRAQLSLDKELGAGHLSAIAGYEIREVNTYREQYMQYGYDSEHATSRVVDLIGSYKLYYNQNSASNLIPNAQSMTDATDRYISWYGNAGYLWKGKYLLSGSARVDRSNIFGVNTNQKGVPLWSAGLGWEISKEGFYHSGILPYLKARLTFGYNGNVDRSLSALTTATYNNGSGNQNNKSTGLPYATISNPPNPELRWEKVSILNAAVEFASRTNRVSGSVEVFDKKGLDLIGNSPLAPSTGRSTFKGNSAEMSTFGVDAALRTLNLTGRFKWSSDIFLSYSKEIIEEYNIKSNNAVSADYVLGILPLAGKPQYPMFSYKWGGLDAEGDPQGYLNGELSKDYAKIISSATLEDLIYHGPKRPVYFGALRNTFAYHDFSFSFNIAYRMGYYIRRNTVNYNDLLAGIATHSDYALRWQNPGDEMLTIVPSVPAARNLNRDRVYQFSEALVDKADHIRLQDISFDYTLRFKQNKGISQLQLYSYISNLGIIWKASKKVKDPDYLSGMVPLRQLSFGLRATF